MLSVICPIYNEEKYIAGCIDSIIAQDYPKDDIEVIFADGMSSDQTRKIVAQYAERYNWIRLVDNPRKDSSSCTERGGKGLREEM